MLFVVEDCCFLKIRFLFVINFSRNWMIICGIFVDCVMRVGLYWWDKICIIKFSVYLKWYIWIWVLVGLDGIVIYMKKYKLFYLFFGSNVFLLVYNYGFMRVFLNEEINFMYCCKWNWIFILLYFNLKWFWI